MAKSHKKTNCLLGLSKEKQLQNAREHKDWIMDQWKKVMWSNPSWSDGRVRVKKEWHEEMHRSCIVPASLWRLCYDVGLLLLLRSTFSNDM